MRRIPSQSIVPAALGSGRSESRFLAHRNGENIKSGLGKIGPFLAKNPERALACPQSRPECARSRPRLRARTGNIGDVILTKGTYAKPDLSQWEEPGEF